MEKNNPNLIIVYYARPKADYFPSDNDFCDDWMVDTAKHYNQNGYLNDQGLYDSLLAAGLSQNLCEKVFKLANKRDIDLDMAECIWGSWLSNRPNKTTTQTFNALNNDLKLNNIPVQFVCNWVF